MKRGSIARKCSECGRKIFWLVPTGEVGYFGERITEQKRIIPWVGRHGRYYCVECWGRVGDGK